MGFGMFSAQASPVAIDFGSSSVKLLQIGGTSGDRPPMIAAAEIPIPDSIRTENDRLSAFYAEWLPKTLRDGRFKGKRAVIAIPGRDTFVHHVQINDVEAGNRDEAIKSHLQAQMGVSPLGVVVRSMEVCPIHRNGESLKEMICFAIGKETVMRHLEQLQRCKLEVVGVHTDTMAMIRAFDHISRRQDDAETTTLYIDLGWCGTRVAITHGRKVAFARYIQLGGKSFDQLIASAVRCDLASARAHRLSLQANNGGAPSLTVEADGQLEGGPTHGRAGQLVGAAGRRGSASATVAMERRTGLTPAALSGPVPPG